MKCEKKETIVLPMKIKEMPANERVAVMEALWDAMCHAAEEPETPAWHEEVLLERRKRRESGEAEYISVEELRARYR